MNNTNVYLSQRLATDSDKFYLSCLIDKKDMTTVWKDTVWLEFTELKDENYPDQTLSWDNPSYLWNELTQYLENKVKFTLTEKQLEEFKDINEYMNLDNCFDLLELLSTAKQLNWHE